MYQLELREAAKEVDQQCGGLKHIELAENDVRPYQNDFHLCVVSFHIVCSSSTGD